MKLPGPWDQDPEKSFQRGPLVIPGAYTARMTNQGVVSEKTFEIKIDPRLAEVNVVLDDLKAQSNLLKEIIALENASRRVLSGIKKNKKELRKLGKTDKIDQPQVIESELIMQEGVYMQPMLSNQFAYLRSMLSFSDQQPGHGAYKRLQYLKTVWKGIAYRPNGSELSDFPIVTGDGFED